jgi:multiple sugar transport system substrate-binding protein
MARKTNRTATRRRFLQAAGGTTAIGLAGCTGNSEDSGDLNVNTETASGGSGDGGSGDGGSGDGGSEDTETASSSSELPTKQEGVEQWGQRLNEYARQAGIDWRQFEGTELLFGMNVHPFTETMQPLLPHFEELTGISVTFNTFPEDQLWQKLTLDFNSGNGKYDGMFLGLWPSARYHNADWVVDLNQFIENSSLTDQEWLHMEDFPQSALDAFTYGDDDFIAMPFGIEAYGCVAYDKPTFETLGLSEPTNFPELRDAAKTIHESDEVNMAGICSRASSTPLSTANWATMFKSYGADWIDREQKTAELNSDAGIASLEMFAELMGDYGPSDIGTYDWYKSNQAFGNQQVGMTYHTPAAAGVYPAEQYERTGFIPPLPGPDGDVVASTWEWALGISQFSENPEAAWLFLQWALSRPANLMQSSRQWQGHAPYGHARSGWIFDQPEYQETGQSEEWINAHNKGMEAVPSSPPPVPLDTPQNMDMMSEAAIAMNAAVTGTKSAEQALNQAAPKIEEFAKQIPDSYL